MKFNYFEFPLSKPSPVLGSSILRPIIPIKISANGLTARYDALIGADFCIFHAEVGFSYNIADHGYGLLGQKGLFDKFLVQFDLTSKQIELNVK